MTSTRFMRGTAVALLLVAITAAAAGAPVLVAKSLKGEVIRHVGSVQASVGEQSTIDPGQIVETRADAGVHLDFLGAIDLTLGSGAALMFHSADQRQLRVKLGAGDFEATVARDADLRFNVGTLRARAVGARVAARMRADGATVCVLEGSVSVQTPEGEKHLDQPGQCLERNGTVELVRGPGAPGAHPLPPIPAAPIVGATALPPPPPAAMSSPAPSAPVPPAASASLPAAPPSVSAPSTAPVAAAAESAPAAKPGPAREPQAPFVPVVIENAPRVSTSVALDPRPVAAAALAPSSGAPSPPTPQPVASGSSGTPAPVTGKPSPIVITPFADLPPVSRVAVNPRPVPDGAVPPVGAGAAPPPSSAPPAAQAAVVQAAPKVDAALEVPPMAAGWTIVVAALNSQASATQESTRLRQKGLPAEIFLTTKDGQDVYRIGIGRFRSYEGAASYVARVKKALPDLHPWIAAFGSVPAN